MGRYSTRHAEGNGPRPRLDDAAHKRLLGGDFQIDDTSWPAISAHLIAFSRWLIEQRVRYAREKASGARGDVTMNIPSAANDRRPGPREAA